MVDFGQVVVSRSAWSVRAQVVQVRHGAEEKLLRFGRLELLPSHDVLPVEDAILLALVESVLRTSRMATPTALVTLAAPTGHVNAKTHS